MKVRMLRRIAGAVNGVEMGPYEIGREYDALSTPPMEGERQALFVEAGFAAEVLPPPLPKVVLPASPASPASAPAIVPKPAPAKAPKAEG